MHRWYVSFNREKLVNTLKFTGAVALCAESLFLLYNIYLAIQNGGSITIFVNRSWGWTETILDIFATVCMMLLGLWLVAEALNKFKPFQSAD